MTADSGIVTGHSGQGSKSVTFRPESPVTFARNRRSRWTGITGHDGPEYPLLSKVGAATISMPATEVYLALQQGVARGVITTPTYAAPARWGEVLKTMTRTSWGMGGYGLAMNKNSWEKLSSAQKEGFMKAVKEVEAWNRSQSLENISTQEAALQKAGLKLVDPTPEQMKTWENLAKPIWDAQPAETKKFIGMLKK